MTLLIAIYLLVGFVFAQLSSIAILGKLGVKLSPLHRGGWILGTLLKMLTWPLSLLVNFGFPGAKDRLWDAFKRTKTVDGISDLVPARPLPDSPGSLQGYSFLERAELVGNMLAVNRRESMEGRGPGPFNNEAMLVILAAPDWFLKPQVDTVLAITGHLKTPTEFWPEIQRDIDKYFPGQFDWENQRNRAV